MSKHYLSYLALGDSYTIGESLPLYENYPYQTVQILRKNGLAFSAPEIIARTGWTSFELAEQLLHTRLNETYDIVSLLIGVNNQYRGLPIEDFKNDFHFLLHKAIHLSGNRPERVVVLSIPDWGVTPYAKDRDRIKIAKEIDAFNTICQEETMLQKAVYLSITEQTRLAKDNPALLAGDHLHYAAKTYAQWAILLAEKIKECLLVK
ncbi:MAG: SGNH/GDSL hydrolase family protein [Bacteroidota bacterium]|nr:SGNH/GDSL hydrolase family protein [Bacteroidota bacterium]